LRVFALVGQNTDVININFRNFRRKGSYAKRRYGRRHYNKNNNPFHFTNSFHYSSNCNKTLYGKTVYVRLASSLRLLTPVAQNSPEWIGNYKRRTASERVNNRILTDYQLERPKRYGKSKSASFAFFNAINIHLDALVNFGSVSLDSFIS
jgi:hypothetical protein